MYVVSSCESYYSPTVILQNWDASVHVVSQSNTIQVSMLKHVGIIHQVEKSCVLTLNLEEAINVTTNARIICVFLETNVHFVHTI